MGNKEMKILIRRALQEGSQLLNDAGINDGRREAGSILGHIIGRDRTFLVAHADDELTDSQLETFRAFLARRARGEPLQYITSHQEFFKLDFEVGPGVLIPRPETELVVEAALEVLKDERAPLIVDIGTGSGCIAVSLLDQLPNARAIATDISNDALRVARRNAERHHVSDRLILIQADGFSAFQKSPAASLIVSNPPYVPTGEVRGLQREVRDYEPLGALASGTDGLSHVRDWLDSAPAILSGDGYFIFEIGFGQRDAVEKTINPEYWKLIEVRHDLQDIPRIFVLQKR